jgi:hypothetical protein
VPDSAVVTDQSRKLVMTVKEDGTVVKLRRCRGEGRLVGPRIDDEEQIALVDHLAVGEVDLG